MNDTIIIIDGNAVFYACKWAYKGLSYDLQETGIVFGFFQTILTYAKKYNTCKFAFVWDTPKALNKRRQLYPAYKANRDEKDSVKSEEENDFDAVCDRQFILLRDYALKKFGFKNVYYYEGFEGDDLIASIVIGQDVFAPESERSKFVVVTNDADMYQLLDYCDVNIKNTLVTKQLFKKWYDIEPAQWITVKVLAGCKSDNLSGIVGVGEESVLKYLTGQLDSKSGMYHKITTGLAEANRIFYPLVKLPFMNTPDIELVHNERFLYRNFKDICDEYDFKSMLRNYKKWDSCFNFR